MSQNTIENASKGHRMLAFTSGVPFRHTTFTFKSVCARCHASPEAAAGVNKAWAAESCCRCHPEAGKPQLAPCWRCYSTYCVKDASGEICTGQLLVQPSSRVLGASLAELLTLKAFSLYIQCHSIALQPDKLAAQCLQYNIRVGATFRSCRIYMCNRVCLNTR